MDHGALDTALKLQAGACRHYGSPFYGDLLEAARAELGRDGPLERLVADWPGDPVRGFLALRLLGAVHEEVLAGEAPELAHHYPSVGGSPRMPEAWHAFRDVLEARRERLRPRLDPWPQTNEVRRCGALLGGFLTVARRLDRPLELREIGASAGLNLLWDRYRYRLGEQLWGDPDSPVEIDVEWRGPSAPLDTPVVVAGRAGCDIAPVRVADPVQARRLESFVWADQPDRLVQLRAAVGLARQEPPRVDRAGAAEWLEAELARADPERVPVVFHSATWGYLGEDERRRVRALLEEYGARAPLAWLRHEHDRGAGEVQITLRLWPPGERIHLAEGHPHGRRVRWLA